MSAALVPAHGGLAGDSYLQMIRTAVRAGEIGPHAFGAPIVEAAEETGRSRRRPAAVPLAAGVVAVLLGAGIMFAAQPWGSGGGSPTVTGPAIAAGSLDADTNRSLVPSASAVASATSPAKANPSSAPTRTPARTSGTTRTPAPAIFASWAAAPSPPTFRVKTVGGASCVLSATGRGTSRTFTAGAGGQANLTWNSPKWSPGTYAVTATCTLGGHSASTPTTTVVVP